MDQMKSRGWIAAASLAALLGWAILDGAQPAPVDGERTARLRALGKAFYENPTTQVKAVEVLKAAWEANPRSEADRLNYALALLRAGQVSEGIAALEEVQKLHPKLPHTWFNLGIEWKKAGETAKAIGQLEQMARLVPDEPITQYNLGVLYKAEGRQAEANAKFELAARLDPNFAAPHFQLFNYYRQQSKVEESRAELARFQDLKRRHEEAGTGNEDVEWSLYSELYESIDPAMAALPAPGALRFVAAAVGPRMEPGAELQVIDLDGSGSTDLLAVSARGIATFRKGLSAVSQPALSALGSVRSAAAGDYDNDGLADLCVVTASGARLFRNVKGRFEPSAVKLADGEFDFGLWLDYDHDYDLDLILFGVRTVVLRNQLPEGFADRSGDIAFLQGRAVSAVATRLVADTKSHDLVVSYAGRPAVLYRDRLGGTFQAAEQAAVPVGAAGLTAADLDNDGSMDLAWRGGAALNRGGRFEAFNWSVGGAFALLDTGNRGVLDAAAAGRIFRSVGRGGWKEQTAEGWPAGAFSSIVAGDFDEDGLSDAAVALEDGRLLRVMNRTAPGSHWARVTLSGVKNLKLSPGAEVELKAGLLYQKRAYRGVPLVFGLRGVSEIDTVRVTWPNGLIQNETKPKSDATLVVTEAPRLSGSCPMVWTWNGCEFEAVTDVLGVAPLGASSGDGRYFPVDHDESVWIDGERLRERDGKVEVRITEELSEVSYLDQIRMFAVDHPATQSIVTNEKWKSPPFPEFRLFGVERRVKPLRAVSDGQDVKALLAARDERYAGGFRRTMAGVAATHALELDFGNAAPDGEAVLVLHGWVDWADGSTFLAQAQSTREGLITPKLQMKDRHGAWVTVIEDMGMPAGKPKTIAVDLTGKWPGPSRQVRIVTNLCLYWDEAFLSDSARRPEARLSELPASQTDLRFRGFARLVIDPARLVPEKFFYQPAAPSGQWNPTPGLYTKYGAVGELLSGVDDRMVIMGSGDELAIEFDPRRLPALPAGWKRDWILMVDGWAKDRDANTAYSQSVEPLPFHGMSRYPYGAGERFPATPEHESWKREFNTRPALRLLRALNETGTTRQRSH